MTCVIITITFQDSIPYTVKIKTIYLQEESEQVHYQHNTGCIHIFPLYLPRKSSRKKLKKVLGFVTTLSKSGGGGL